MVSNILNNTTPQEVILKAGQKLDTKLYSKYVDPTIYKPAMQEFKNLEPHLTVLMGKGITMEDEMADTTGRIAYGLSTEHKEQAPVQAAAKALYVWLELDNSELRSVLAFLSAGGLFYVASVHEKSHRAYLQHGFGAPQFL